MRDGDNGAVEEPAGWPEYHFSGHRKRFPEFDAASMRAMLTLRIAAQRVENALGSWFLDADLTPQKFGVLIVLQAEGKPISLSDLRRCLGTTQANVTGLVAGLERDGYIERRASTEDRRVSYISLARAGKRILASMLPQYFARSKAATKILTQSEKKQLVTLLEKLARGFDETDS